MKKVISFTALFIIGLFSCTKEKNETSGSSHEGKLEKNGSNQTIGTPTMNVRIGSYNYTAGTSTESIQVFAGFEGTAPRSEMEKLRVVIQKTSTDSIVLTDGNVVEGWWQDRIVLEKSKTYPIYVYVTIPVQVFGTIIPILEIAQGNYRTGLISGQTTTLGYEAAPTITSTSLTMTPVVNGTFIPLSKVMIKAPISGPIAIKQLAWRSTFTNNSGSGVLRFDSLRLFFKGTDVTAQWYLIDSLGTRVTSISQASAASKKLYAVAITGDGEIEIGKGTGEVLELMGVPRGFGPDSLISDVATVTLVNDATAAPEGYTYLNKGSTGLHAKLYSSPNQSSAAKPYNFIWSPKKIVPHSAAYGAPCPDWHQGYGITFTAEPTILHSRN